MNNLTEKALSQKLAHGFVAEVWDLLPEGLYDNKRELITAAIGRWVHACGEDTCDLRGMMMIALIKQHAAKLYHGTLAHLSHSAPDALHIKQSLSECLLSYAGLQPGSLEWDMVDAWYDNASNGYHYAERYNGRTISNIYRP